MLATNPAQSSRIPPASPPPTPPGGAPMFSCTARLGKLAVHFPHEVVAGLLSAARAASKSVPGRGLEIGGILLGRKEIDSGVTTCWVEDVLPVTSEHRAGPSYLLSEADIGRIDEAVGKHQRNIIGCYRTQTRSQDLYLENPDMLLLDRCCVSSDAIFLLIMPLSGIIGVFIRGEEKLVCVHQFVADLRSRPAKTRTRDVVNRRPETPPIYLNPSPSPPPSREKHASPSSPQDRASTSVGREPLTISNDAGARKRLWPIWAASAVAILVVAAAAALWLRGQAEQSMATARRTYILNAKAEGQALRVLWDSKPATSRPGSVAVLRISDGNDENDMLLTPLQMRTGSLLYTPKTSDVTFRLEIYRGLPITESIRIIDGSEPGWSSEVRPEELGQAARQSNEQQ